MPVRFTDEEFEKLKRILTIHEWGLKTVMTKLDIIQEDLKSFQDNWAIDHIRCRLKEPMSIAQKLENLKLEVTADNVEKYLRDIAGVRIICPFAKDIYYLVNLIRNIPDITVTQEKDYISEPKASGYRSYHIILEVPVFHSGKLENVAVEVQIRTDAMNFWANLEHKAKYKYKEDIPKHLSDELIKIADRIAELDQRMFGINELISLMNKEI